MSYQNLVDTLTFDSFRVMDSVKVSKPSDGTIKKLLGDFLLPCDRSDRDAPGVTATCAGSGSGLLVGAF